MNWREVSRVSVEVSAQTRRQRLGREWRKPSVVQTEGGLEMAKYVGAVLGEELLVEM